MADERRLTRGKPPAACSRIDPANRADSNDSSTTARALRIDSSMIERIDPPLHPIADWKITNIRQSFQNHFALFNLILFHIIKKSLTPDFHS
ncbi:hypothetical protein LGM65_01580 [Burkholderia anthina]|uniref:hypothetical protein n=1 Tax=Burkholderia anthina TaxID=179879 RepID=UPI001CF43E4E|nr:hypothetical protein [Burkholderia anthina]MCA8089586.1 hypothetical protein [Burkholderia anthina]